MKLPHFISNLPLRRKVTLLLLMPCLAVLLTAGAALFIFQIQMFRKDFMRDMDSVAKMVSTNSTAAISFENAEDATQVLGSLQAKEDIISAAFVLPDGRVFAKYGRHTEPPVYDTEDRFTFREQDALTVKPVMHNGKQIATLNLVSDYRTVYAGIMKLVGWMLLLVVLVGTAVATLLSSWMQRLISEPVLRLARAAQEVADRNDYSIRVREGSGVELRNLIRTFNQMLARIQEQDAAITQSQQKLETLINSIESIVWECLPDTFQFTFVSRQVERILGYTPEQWTADPRFWHDHLHPDDAAAAIQICHGYATAGKPYSYEYRMVAADGREVWIRESGSIVHENGRPTTMRGIFQDITDQKKAAEEVERLNRRLLEASRLAGMAEVATGVLHNVGNVLNSVSVSAALVTDRLKQLKLANLRRAAGMLREQDGNLVHFLTEDPKGRVLPEYLTAVSEQLTAEQNQLIQEVAVLTQNIEHIKEIVAMQQGYAKVSGAFEHLAPTELVEDALRINAAAFERHRVEVVREYRSRLPRVNVDRHKVLQILINLLRNAKYALDAGNPPHRRLVVRVENGDASKVTIRIRDNGAGIAPENLARIFALGFTTKKDGHGFGLHSAANAAREMGGRLTAHSEGLGRGAEFSLELPAVPRVGLPETFAPAPATGR
jgi:PAS domain S-box-containing protein